VLVTMMNVWKVRMAVAQGRVLVFMAVGFGAVPLECMFVLVVFIVDVSMTVKKGLVLMFMGMAFLEVNPDPQPINKEATQNSPSPIRPAAGWQWRRRGTARWKNRHPCVRSQPAQGQYKQHQADTVTEEADDQGWAKYRHRWQRCPERQRQGTVHQPGAQTLYTRNEQRVRG
jgi:hypothetical protein